MAVPPIMHAEHRVVRALRGAGAVAPGAAQPFAPARAIDGRALERLVAAGAVGDAGGGRYWLDPAGYGAWRAARRRRVLIALAVVLALVLVFASTGVIRQGMPA